MWGNILTEVSHLHNINMSFLEHFLHLKGSSNVSYNLTYINTGKYNYNYNINRNILCKNKNQLDMLKGIIFHPLSVWHIQFTLNNQTQGFNILTNLTSNPSHKYNTYCVYKNCFVDNPMLILEENRILDFLRPKRGFEANSTFNESIRNYQPVLEKRLFLQNRNYLYLELYNNLPHKHKLLHFLQ